MSRMKEQIDWVNHPPHYKSHPSGVECIEITEHMNFCIGNAIKYLWRADEKGKSIEDLEKAEWYVRREIERRTAAAEQASSVTAEALTPEWAQLGLELIEQMNEALDAHVSHGENWFSVPLPGFGVGPAVSDEDEGPE